jgi:hypothetical protein
MADFFTSLTTEMLRQDVDWAEKDKGKTSQHSRSSGRTARISNGEEGSNSDNKENHGDEGILDLIIPTPIIMMDSERRSADKFLKLASCEKCTPIRMSAVPFPLKKRAKSCQICSFELKNLKWKGVVLCPNHGVRLCTESSPPRALAANT